MEESVRLGKHGLAGVLHSPPETRVCVIACHGLLSTKDSPKYVELAKRLYEGGIAFFRFDFRGCGESPGKLEQTTLLDRIEDLGSALDFVVEERGHVNVGLMGSSLGGCVSILKAKDERVKALVTWATPCLRGEIPSEFLKTSGFDVIRALRESDRPILIIHGTSDEIVPPSEAHVLYENANQPKSILMVEGADHVFSDSIHREKAIRATVDWFRKYLG